VCLAISGNERLQHLFTQWTSYVIVPLLALAKPGVELNGDVVRRAVSSPVTLGICCPAWWGLVGITIATLSTRPRLGRLPLTLTWPALVGAATVAGIGFTVALLIADITSSGEDLETPSWGSSPPRFSPRGLAWVVFQAIVPTAGGPSP
jgi:Na+/H+ antiporter NhaA